MAEVSATAAAASMVIPFHCIICFDEFNFTDKTPMVLPCGHTFVCCSCTKRLKRCMECREPLFWTPPQQQNTQSVHRGTASHQFTVMEQRCHARYGTPMGTPLSPPRVNLQRPEPLPLPISRNVVMLAMMEAAERQKSVESSQNQEFTETQGEEIDKIVTALEAMAGQCGTYAIKDQLGVAVLPNDPRKGYSHSSSNTNPNDVVKEPFKIQKGQTVQIVSVEDGVYQLARDAGYIVASDSQLVKVNGPQDTVCQLQGMLTLAKRREEELRKRLQQIESLYTGLGQRILEEQELEPSHPIITDVPDDHEEEDTKERKENPTKELFDDQRAVSPSPHMVAGKAVDCPQSQSPRETVVAPSASGDGEMEMMDSSSSDIVHLAPQTPNTIDNSDIREAGSFYADENVFPGPNTPYMCSDFSFFRGDGDALEEQLSFDDPTTASLRQHFEAPALHHGHHDGHHDGHRGAPQITQSASTGMIDFSTGLSGHRGVNSSKSRGPRGAQQPMSHRHIRMMGEHRGISWFRGHQGPSKKQSP